MVQPGRHQPGGQASRQRTTRVIRQGAKRIDQPLLNRLGRDGDDSLARRREPELQAPAIVHGVPPLDESTGHQARDHLGHGTLPGERLSRQLSEGQPWIRGDPPQDKELGRRNAEVPFRPETQ